jgi:biopolymer transport protein ExbB/TolQ
MIDILQRCGPGLGLAFVVLATVITAAGTTTLLAAFGRGLALEQAQAATSLLSHCGSLAGTLGFIGTVYYSRGILLGFESVSAANGSTLEMLASLKDVSGALNTTLVGMALQVVGMAFSAAILRCAREVRP